MHQRVLFKAKYMNIFYYYYTCISKQNKMKNIVFIIAVFLSKVKSFTSAWKTLLQYFTILYFLYYSNLVFIQYSVVLVVSCLQASKNSNKNFLFLFVFYQQWFFIIFLSTILVFTFHVIFFRQTVVFHTWLHFFFDYLEKKSCLFHIFEMWTCVNNIAKTLLRLN